MCPPKAALPAPTEDTYRRRRPEGRPLPYVRPSLGPCLRLRLTFRPPRARTGHRPYIWRRQDEASKRVAAPHRGRLSGPPSPRPNKLAVDRTSAAHPLRHLDPPRHRAPKGAPCVCYLSDLPLTLIAQRLPQTGLTWPTSLSFGVSTYFNGHRRTRKRYTASGRRKWRCRIRCSG